MHSQQQSQSVSSGDKLSGKRSFNAFNIKSVFLESIFVLSLKLSGKSELFKTNANS